MLMVIGLKIKINVLDIKGRVDYRKEMVEREVS